MAASCPRFASHDRCISRIDPCRRPIAVYLRQVAEAYFAQLPAGLIPLEPRRARQDAERKCVTPRSDALRCVRCTDMGITSGMDGLHWHERDTVQQLVPAWNRIAGYSSATSRAMNHARPLEKKI